MTSLVIPAAGQSTRFPNMRPKWLLTHPDGTLMICAAIKKLKLEQFSKIYVGVLRKHLDAHISEDTLRRAFRDADIDSELEIVILDQATRDQVDTVLQIVEGGGITGPIVIKDCDNQFSLDVSADDFVAYASLGDFRELNATNKSYIDIDAAGSVTNIIEKKVISDTFCVGAYGFSDAAQFVEVANEVGYQEDRFISNIIHAKMLTGRPFKALKVANYHDWGTRHDWINFIGRFKTVFCDIDGVLVQNGSQYFRDKQWGEMAPLEANAERLAKLYDEGNTYIVLTTSRGEEFRKTTELELREFGVRYHQLVMGLPHCPRVLVNDYSSTNPYPSATAVNIPRDADNLSDYI